MLLDNIRIIVHMDISCIISLYTPVSFCELSLCYCVCNYCVVYCFECVCVILCLLCIVLCIVVPLPPGTDPLAGN
jgi:hypothetical protein